MKISPSILARSITLALLTLTACQQRITLQEGERIIFLGDSITELGDRPGGYVTLVRDSLAGRYPDLGIEVIGAGVDGNKVPDLEERLDRDVLYQFPTIVVVYIGINDVWHSILDLGGTPVDRYEQGLRDILLRIGDSGARALLCTPTVIGEKHDGTNPLDDMLEEYAEINRRIARELGIIIVDLRKVFLRYLRDHNLENIEDGMLTYDGVHLTSEGNRLVAGELLKILGAKQG